MQIPARATLNDLDASRPGLEAASLLANTIRLHRNTPIELLATEALRFLLEENESLAILLRVAIDRLERDPFLQGDYHAGDLLVAVLTRPAAVFQSHPELRSRAFLVARDAEELLDLLDTGDQRILRGAIVAFQRACLPEGPKR
jgi:hypothetical protein